MMFQPTRRALVAAGIGSLAAPHVGAATPQGKLVLGQVSLSFYAVTGAVIQQVLERLGHMVEVKSGPHEEMFPLLAAGEIDLMAAAWLPEGHAAYWSRYGQGARIVTKLYDGARFFWGVPDHLPADAVSTIGDLAQPEVAQRMAKTIQGIGSGAAISTLSQKAVAEYGLDRLGYAFRPGTPAEWTSAYAAAERDGTWMVFPTWAPQYLNRGGKIRPLADPKGIFGGMNHAALVSPQERFASLPERTRAVLERVELGLDGVTEMDWLVNARKLSPQEAARSWIGANRERFAGWFVA